MTQELVTSLLNSINFIYVIIVVLGGYFAKMYLGGFKIAMAWKTLFTATFFLAMYMLAQYFAGDLSRKDLPRALHSYVLATSLYELLLKYVIDGILKRFQ